MARLIDTQGKRLGIFVLAYNAERLLADTLRRIPEDVWRAVEVVYVVDDCSQDETTRTALDFPAHRDKLVVFRNRINRRYGGNQKFGYQYAIDRGLDAVVMLHGDGQYAPEMLPQIFRPLVVDDADMVNASRMIARRDALAGGMPLYKFVANIGLTAFENALSGLRMSEFHSGYRGYSTRFLRRIPLWENTDEWHFDSQILFQAQVAKTKIVEIAIPTHYGDEICHVNGISYGLHCLISATAFALHRAGIVCLPRYDLRPAKLAENRRSAERFSDHSIIVRRLLARGIAGKRVLDIGFGCAAIAAKLHEAGAVLDGIDINPAAIAENGGLYDQTWLADANRIDDVPLRDKYDVILLSDLLQYLVDPADMLSRLKKHLVKGGTLVVSVPNVANIHVRLALLLGRFRPFPAAPPRHPLRQGAPLLRARDDPSAPAAHGLARGRPRRLGRAARADGAASRAPRLPPSFLHRPGPDAVFSRTFRGISHLLMHQPQRIRPALIPP